MRPIQLLQSTLDKYHNGSYFPDLSDRFPRFHWMVNTNCDGFECVPEFISRLKIHFVSTFHVRILFAVYAGIGMLAMPVDLVNAFIERPKYMDAKKYSQMRMALDKRLAELIEIGEKLDDEMKET